VAAVFLLNGVALRQLDSTGDRQGCIDASRSATHAKFGTALVPRASRRLLSIQKLNGAISFY
jgi:hypothetical protein